jgi:hypothetical protein
MSQEFDVASAKPFKNDAEFDFSTAKPYQTSWADVANKASSNFIHDAGNVVNDTATAVLHPLDTAKGVLDVANGGLQNILPKSVVDVMHHLSPDTANNPEKFDGLINHYKTRYGSEEGFKQALSEHPVETLMDLSAVLSGGGSLASKAPQLSKAGAVVAKAGDIVNPLAAGGKAFDTASGAIGATAPAVLGATTGVGADHQGRLSSGCERW